MMPAELQRELSEAMARHVSALQLGYRMTLAAGESQPRGLLVLTGADENTDRCGVGGRQAVLDAMRDAGGFSDDELDRFANDAPAGVLPVAILGTARGTARLFVAMAPGGLG